MPQLLPTMTTFLPEDDGTYVGAQQTWSDPRQKQSRVDTLVPDCAVSGAIYYRHVRQLQQHRLAAITFAIFYPFTAAPPNILL